MIVKWTPAGSPLPTALNRWTRAGLAAVSEPLPDYTALRNEERGNWPLSLTFDMPGPASRDTGPAVAHLNSLIANSYADSGACMVFNGSQGLFRSDAPANFAPNGDFTFLIDCYLATKASTQIVAAYHSAGAAGTTRNGWEIGYSHTADTFYARMAWGGSSNSTGISAINFGSPALNTWHWLAFNYQASTRRMGLAVASNFQGPRRAESQPTYFTLGGAPLTNAGVLRFGYGFASGTFAPLTGRLVEARCWRRLLSTVELVGLSNFRPYVAP